MHSVPQLNPGSIQTVSGIQSRPVFFLTLVGQTKPTVTVKGDVKKLGSDVSISWGSKLMKHVNSAQVNTKIMNDMEVGVFKQAALRSIPPGDARLRFVQGDFQWVKMPFVPGLSDAGVLDNFANEENGPNAINLKDLARKLAIKSTWFELGKVIAVDMFNGNFDRFTYQGEWQNRGNLMFQQLAPGGPIKVIGLDTYDPTSSNSNLASKALRGGPEDLDPMSGEKALNVLRNTNLDFAKKVTASVSSKIVVGMKRCNMASMSVRGSPDPIIIEIKEGVNAFLPYAAELQRGITQGARDLKAYLQTKVASTPPPRIVIGTRGAPQKSIPAGVLARMRFLGWTT